MRGPVPPDWFVSNGCSYSPDILGGIDIRPACHFHDWAYSQAGDEADRYWCDYVLKQNLIACGLSRFWANVYFYRVRFWGHWAFAYSVEPKRTLWFWLKLLIGRYVSW